MGKIPDFIAARQRPRSPYFDLASGAGCIHFCVDEKYPINFLALLHRRDGTFAHYSKRMGGLEKRRQPHRELSPRDGRHYQS